MKATLEFNLPEEQSEFETATKGSSMLVLLSDLFEEIRSNLKYDSGAFKDYDKDTLEEVRNYIQDKMRSLNISLYD